GLATLIGGKNQDLLIGGTTAFDHNVAALDALMQEWSSPTPYPTQIAHLLGTKTGGKNGTVLLVPTGANATVFNDGLANVLPGCLGLDRFFKSAPGNPNDLNNGGKEGPTALP